MSRLAQTLATCALLQSVACQGDQAPSQATRATPQEDAHATPARPDAPGPQDTAQRPERAQTPGIARPPAPALHIHEDDPAPVALAATIPPGDEPDALILLRGGRWALSHPLRLGSTSGALVPIPARLISLAQPSASQPWDAWLATSPTRRHTIVERQGEVWMLDSVSGQREDLSALGLSRTPNRRSELGESIDPALQHDRAVSFSLDGQRLTMILEGDRALLLRDLRSGSTTRIEAPAGKLIWRAEPAMDPTQVRLWLVDHPQAFTTSAGPRPAPADCGFGRNQQLQDRRVQAQLAIWQAAHDAQPPGALDAGIAASARRLDQGLTILARSASAGTSGRVERVAHGVTISVDARRAYVPEHARGALKLPKNCALHQVILVEPSWLVASCQDDAQVLYDLQTQRSVRLPKRVEALAPWSGGRQATDDQGQRWVAVRRVSAKRDALGWPAHVEALGRMRASDGHIQWLIEGPQLQLSRITDQGEPGALTAMAVAAQPLLVALTPEELLSADVQTGKLRRWPRPQAQPGAGAWVSRQGVLLLNQAPLDTDERGCALTPSARSDGQRLLVCP